MTGQWIISLRKNELVPLMEEIEVVTCTLGEAVKRETYWITRFLEEGMPLTNVSGAMEIYDQKVTLYLSWRQIDKLDEMERQYRRRMKKRTDHNKLMRMMVDHTTLNDLLSEG